MTAETISTFQADATIHPSWVRVCHWINALAILVMIGSGWQIYDASPLFRSLEFSKHIALGQWLGGALLWHFAAMWLLVVNGIVYVTLGLATGRFKRKLLPIYSVRGARPTPRRRSPSGSRMTTSRTTTPCRSCFTPASSCAAS